MPLTWWSVAAEQAPLQAPSNFDLNESLAQIPRQRLTPLVGLPLLKRVKSFVMGRLCPRIDPVIPGCPQVDILPVIIAKERPHRPYLFCDSSRGRKRKAIGRGLCSQPPVGSPKFLVACCPPLPAARKSPEISTRQGCLRHSHGGTNEPEPEPASAHLPL
jgi:hypothetical protein